MGNTSIEWTDRTWNPVRGCSRVSEGCRNCYAERQASRFCKDDLSNHNEGDQPFHGFVKITPYGPRWTGKVELVEKHLLDPLKWRKPQRVFVNSMSDLFHENLPDEAIDRVFAVMALAQIRGHVFQILTKRPERMLSYISSAMPRVARLIEPELGPLPDGMIWPIRSVWLGVSVEDQATSDARIPLLLRTPAEKRFVSYEPALGPVDFSVVPDRPLYSCCACGGSKNDDCGYRNHGEDETLDWIIVGGESGPGARPFDIAWARQTIQQCKEAGVDVFCKQLGARPHDGYIDASQCFERWLKLKDRKGGDMAEWPSDLRVREFPE